MDTELHFDQKNYFLRFKINDDEQLNHVNKHVRHALEYFVDDLQRNRNKIIEYFLNEQTIKDIFLAISQLLLCTDDRICGNSAYIIGSIVETEEGLKQFLSIFVDNQTSETVDIIRTLCQLLTHSDADCVLNAAGTLGTICASKEGRDLVVKHVCVSQVILNTSMLLNSTNSWTASNAALVLARITVEEVGCRSILTHNKRHEILNRLVAALDINDSSRSTNIAFAIARLIEEEDGKKILINDCGQKKFFEALLIMLEIDEDKGIHKNACYALSCLCTSSYGYQLCIQSITLFHRILRAIETILLSIEQETVWFALMCLTTIAKYEEANEHLCYSKNLLGIIKQIQEKWIGHKDIQDESKLLWFMLHKCIKPKQPKIDACRDTSVDISWDACIDTENLNEVQYCVLLDDIPITRTNKTNYSLNNLRSNASYNVKIQYVTKHGESNPSDPTVFRTDDQLPPPVINLHAARTTMTAVRIAWEAPDLSACNSFRGYQTYLNDVEYEVTNECGITISSLAASTTYQIDVCVVTMRGKGPCASIIVKTDSAGDSLPPPPTFSVIGRRELHVKWQPPEFISGRLSRYELICNGRCIYSGTDQEHHATMLKSDKEYTISVIVITNEGRFRSRPAKTRTLKDEFLRHSVYESPSPRLKRTDIASPRKVSPTIERQLTKDMIIPNQNVRITTVRSVQIKSENSSSNRGLPGIFRNSQSRPSRNLQRSKTDMSSQQISPSIVIPTLNINHSSKSKSYRYPLLTRSPERCSPSIPSPDLPYTLQRIS